MMLRLSRQTVRYSWPPYVGALVALSLGVALLTVAITTGVAVETTAKRSGTTAAEHAQLSGLSSLFGIMSGIALFMAVFVVGSTFGFVVATRRRQLGLLRLVGATPRQVRLMVLGESAVVALLSAIVGCLLGSLATPSFLALLRWRGIIAVDLALGAPWTAWAVAASAGITVALMGAWRSSKRAARTSPLAVFQEAGLERRRPTLWQLLIGTVCLAGSVVALVLSHRLDPLFALITGMLLPEAVVLGLYCLGGWVFPPLAGLLGRLFAHRDVAVRLAVDHVRTGVRAPVALAAPLLAISAIAGSMIVTLSFTADWATALDRQQLSTPYVVEAGDDRISDRLSDLPLVDPRITLPLSLGKDRGTEDVEIIDPVTAPAARGLQVIEGSLKKAANGVVITDSWETDAGVHLGDRLLGGRVVAVVQDAPDLYADVMIGRGLVPSRRREPVPDLWFVNPGPHDLNQVLAGTDAQILTADTWLHQIDAQTRAGNNLGLWVLLGPSGVYAAIAIVNSVLVSVSQRRPQLRTAALLGATGQQLRRMALWEAGLVGAAALLAGSLITALVGWSIRSATSADVADQPLTIPWFPLSAVAATCLALTLLAAFAGGRRATEGFA